MNETEFALSVNNTLIDGYHEDQVTPHELDVRLVQLITICKLFDELEKALFRGEPMARRIQPVNTSLTHRPELRDAIRCVIGAASEIGEMAENLHRALSGEAPLDSQRFISELGDLAWYEVFGYRQTGVTRAQVLDYNMQKLAKRNNEVGDALANRKSQAPEA